MRPNRILQLAMLCCLWAPAIADDTAPQTVNALWAGVDPRAEPIDSTIVREWEKDNVVYRYVTFHIANFKNRPSRMAAYFAFPRDADRLPGLLHLHGGGQRAFLHEVEFYAKRGYACLSINWGGRVMEQAESGDPNTDWGAVDPTQQNVAGYFNLKPGDQYLDSVDSPRNNNWYLLTLAARRALTFLELQPEVDPSRIGVYGHSMGGNLTVYVAGSDDRVRAAAPSVGGSGFRNQPWPLLPEHKKQLPNGDVGLFDATLGFESYTPHIHAPLLWLGATNDFHGIIDDTYRTSELIPHSDVRFAFTPHMNHRFTPAFAVTRPLWLDQYLKGTFEFPKTPASKLQLHTSDGVPILQVLPDTSMPIEQVNIFYSIDPAPQARFWRTAHATEQSACWTASLPILSIDQPIFAFANVHYRMPTSESEPYAPPTSTFAISSILHTASPDDLRRAGTQATDQRSVLIDDFSNRWQDWYTLSANNPHHWEYSTRKLSDPKWQGKPSDSLQLQVQSESPNELVLILTENFFRSHRGPSNEYVAVVSLTGGNPETFVLPPNRFTTLTGTQLSSWSQVDVLSLRAYFEKDGIMQGSKKWRGPQPRFLKLSWKQSETK